MKYCYGITCECRRTSLLQPLRRMQIIDPELPSKVCLNGLSPSPVPAPEIAASIYSKAATNIVKTAAKASVQVSVPLSGASILESSTRRAQLQLTRQSSSIAFLRIYRRSPHDIVSPLAGSLFPRYSAWCDVCNSLAVNFSPDS